MVGPQPLQGLLQLFHGDLLISAVGANLAHKENFIAPSLSTKPHPFLAAVVVVLPCVVEKSDSCIYRLLNQAYGQIARLHRPEMISANADDRDLFPRFSERSARNLVSAAVRRLRRNCSRYDLAGQNGSRKHCPRGRQACLDQAPALDFGSYLGSLILSTLIHHGSSPRRLWCCLWHQPGAVRLFQHLRDLSLSVIEGKSMGHPGHRVVIPQRYLVWLEAAVGRGRGAKRA